MQSFWSIDEILIQASNSLLTAVNGRAALETKNHLQNDTKCTTICARTLESVRLCVINLDVASGFLDLIR